MIFGHNIDVCQNLQHLEESGNKKFIKNNLPEWRIVENDIFFNKWDLKTCYLVNLKYSLYSFVCVVIFSFLTGYNLGRK